MDDLRAQVSKRVKNAVRSLLLENGLDSSAVEIEETADGLMVRVMAQAKSRKGKGKIDVTAGTYAFDYGPAGSEVETPEAAEEATTEE